MNVGDYVKLKPGISPFNAQTNCTFVVGTYGRESKLFTVFCVCRACYYSCYALYEGEMERVW